MSHNSPRIVVAGDICVDWLHWHSPAGDEGQNWELYEGSHWVAVPGGALLLAKMLRQTAGVTVIAADAKDAEDLPPTGVLESFAELDTYPATGASERRRVYRIARFRGYACRPTGPCLLPIGDDDPGADVLILDDAGNCFREAEAFWPAALKEAGRHPIVIYKMARPLLQGALWDRVKRSDAERLVIVVNADHLRAFGVNISRRLSWERTAKDLVWQLASNPALTELANARHLVVRMGLEGAFWYTSGPAGMAARLIFDPAEIEGAYSDIIPGQMQGYSDAFVAALALSFACPESGPISEGIGDRMGEGIMAGLRAARLLLEMGYGQAGEPGRDAQAEAARIAAEIQKFPRPEILPSAKDSRAWYLANVDVPNPTMPEPPDPAYWCILKEVQGAVLDEVAAALVRLGQTEALRGVPMARFGRLRTADRAEIEGLRTIRNLMDEYLNGESTRPLSIAVFGFPGSGKSFSVTEVARSVGQRRVQPMEFNLSQFRSPEDLTRAFHSVQDQVLEGAVPLVFFDEFDTPFDGDLGWLKYFLAPMQDGKFRDGEAVHPIGKAIFVFAGGTCHSFQAFARLEESTGAGTSPGSALAADQRFRAAKGPDFVSRLRGHVNILGPNPVDESDSTFVVRRAMLLRSLIERKARQILDSRGHARIDEGVLRAMLRVPQYRHGARSMEAILDMSMLSGRRQFDQAALPPGEQMTLHVDADLFTRLMLRDALLGAAREKLGEAVQEHYRETQQGTKAPDDPSMLPWGELDEGLRESCRQQADQIEAKLRKIGCSLRPVPAGRAPVASVFSPAEIEIMARMEHDRWMAERRVAGWVFGAQRDVLRKITPWLVAWDELPEEVKQWDRNAVAAIPAVVARARFEVYRLGRG